MQVAGDLGHLHKMPETSVCKAAHATLIIALLRWPLNGFKWGQRVHIGVTSGHILRQVA